MQIESNHNRRQTMADVEGRRLGPEIAKRYKGGRLGSTCECSSAGKAPKAESKTRREIRRNLESANRQRRWAQANEGLRHDTVGGALIRKAGEHAVSAAMGGGGRAGGLPTALAELAGDDHAALRVIQGVARRARVFDAHSRKNVQFDCIQVFRRGGPLSEDDGADLGVLSHGFACLSAAGNAGE